MAVFIYIEQKLSGFKAGGRRQEAGGKMFGCSTDLKIAVIIDDFLQ
ncbi:MAG: hypothetical protein QNJ08_15115 [Crocosphaera sp.]|nr:hypothetical protein [Crocosphaera sp.]